MTVGKSATVANNYLKVYQNTAMTGIASVFVKLHIGDPGAAGTANASALTTRQQITWGTPASGSMALATLSAFTMTASETISHISLWDASTAGNFLESAALTSSVPVVSGSTLTFNSFTLAFSPIAA
jgi:hypothetical protein